VPPLRGWGRGWAPFPGLTPRARRFRPSGALLLLLVFLTACAPDYPHDGPIVLITLDSLRADAVEGLGGEPGLTPRMDELIREADWAGPAIASSSWEGSTMATIFTGLRPWQHQVLFQGRARLSPALITLAEALQAAGYKTAGHWSGQWNSHTFGFNQGFDVFQNYGKGARLMERLREIKDERQFIWAHLPAPAAPYVRNNAFLPRLGRTPPQLPRKILPMQIERWFDPATPLPLNQRRRLWAMYCLNVASADEQLGRLLDSLRASGEWDRTLLVVTANHGEEFGEKGQILHGGNLGRQLLEVPLIVKLPAGFEREIRMPKRQRVPTTRIWATLVVAAGGEVPPAAAPSLFRQSNVPAVSELYLTNGTNHFSLVEGDDQLLWESRFAPPEPDYYLARMAFRSKESREQLQEPPRAVFTRLRNRFSSTPPLHGIEAPQLTLERWTARGNPGTRPVSDPVKAREMAARLVRSWGTFVPDELPLSQEAHEWAEVGGEKARKPGKQAARKKER
jgi:arylsulfatase A-like enzyme